MRVFRTTYKARNGKTKEAQKWYVEFRDHLDTVRRLPAFASKPASEEMGRNLEKLVAYHKGSGGQTDPALTRFLTGLPPSALDRLVTIGLLAPDRVATAKPLADHLDDFAAALKAKGNSDFHVQVVAGRARRAFEGCGFRFYGDISASKVMEYLDGLRADTEKKRGMSAQTFNFYIQAIKQFCRWMVRDHRAIESPLAHLDGLNVKTDRRRDRHPLTVEELGRLMVTTRRGPERYDMTGLERAMLYLVAVESGLRSNEMRSLARASFDLDGSPATVTVSAAYSKRRREDTLPLRPALAHELRSFLSALTPATQVFRIPKDRKKAAAMFRADVIAAGIPYFDDAGRVADFHSLRHTFITNLAAGGVHPKTAQALARHSTITLTMDRYTHSLHQDLTQALEALPDLSGANLDGRRATGTEDARPDAPPKTAPAARLALPKARLAPRLGVLLGASGATSMPSMDSDRRTKEGEATGAAATQTLEMSGETSKKRESGSVWESNPLTAFFKPPTGFEDQGPHQRCKHSRESEDKEEG
jgi:integrase/recombinase XerD